MATGKQRQLMNVSSPHIKENHYPVTRLLDVVSHLEQPRKQGYVHDDIRGYNKVPQGNNRILQAVVAWAQEFEAK
jgi:hypothetical protein